MHVTGGRQIPPVPVGGPKDLSRVKFLIAESLSVLSTSYHSVRSSTEFKYSKFCPHTITFTFPTFLTKLTVIMCVHIIRW